MPGWVLRSMGACPIFTTQCFHWVPGLSTRGPEATRPYSHFELLNVVTRWQVDVIVRADVGGVDSNTVTLDLTGDRLDEAHNKAMANE